MKELALDTERMIGRMDGPIGWMIFNNPASRNAVSSDMWAAMATILEAFEADPTVRVIVLRGAGDKAFVSGADISEFEKQRSSPETVAKYDALGGRAQQLLADSRKPTIAMIEGYCIGGGLGIAVGCDLRIAATGSKFGVPAARLGLGYGADGVKKLLDLVGPAYAREIFYTARHFTADEAHMMGLVNRVVPEAALEAYVRGYCDTISANAPLTMQTLKRTVTELLRSPERFDRDLCDRLVAECFASQDYIEGRRAFMEKRNPVFRGF